MRKSAMSSHLLNNKDTARQRSLSNYHLSYFFCTKLKNWICICNIFIHYKIDEVILFEPDSLNVTSIASSAGLENIFLYDFIMLKVKEILAFKGKIWFI